MDCGHVCDAEKSDTPNDDVEKVYREFEDLEIKFFRWLVLMWRMESLTHARMCIQAMLRSAFRDISKRDAVTTDQKRIIEELKDSFCLKLGHLDEQAESGGKNVGGQWSSSWCHTWQTTYDTMLVDLGVQKTFRCEHCTWC